MRTYLVTWEIEIEASSHWNAAHKAKEIMDDLDSLATVRAK